MGRLARRRIEKAPKPAKPSPCRQCGDTRGLCISDAVKFVPEQMWAKKPRRTK
jgi:hypothetical protein